jgi:hypothetical protein
MQVLDDQTVVPELQPVDVREATVREDPERLGRQSPAEAL